MTPGSADDGGGGIIGRVVFDQAGRRIEAVLHADGRWSCAAAPAVAESLNREGDPGGGSRGRDALVRAARSLRGLAWLGPDRSGPAEDSPDCRGG